MKLLGNAVGAVIGLLVIAGMTGAACLLVIEIMPVAVRVHAPLVELMAITVVAVLASVGGHWALEKLINQ